MAKNISQIYEYRLALSRIDEFYHLRQESGANINQAFIDDINSQVEALTVLFTSKVQQIYDDTKIINYSGLDV